MKTCQLVLPSVLPLQKHPANPDLQASKAAVWQQGFLSRCSCYILSCGSCERIHTNCAMGLLCSSGEGASGSQSCPLAAPGGRRMVGSTGTVVNPGTLRVLGGAEMLTETCKQLLGNTALERLRSLRGELLESW